MRIGFGLILNRIVAPKMSTLMYYIKYQVYNLSFAGISNEAEEVSRGGDQPHGEERGWAVPAGETMSFPMNAAEVRAV